MGKVNWTNEQMQAIYEKDSNILVAAAAGSGKTAVLVERMIHRIIDDNVDIDKILVVTFTNAAASEMRQRVLEAIYKKLEEEPENKNLQRQIILLAKSNICTIHSFCLDVIKNHFYEIDISPNFKIGEQAELEILKQEVLEELFEKKYEQEDKEFLDLINTYTGYRGDEPLKDIILNIYQYIQSMPFPKKWLQEKVDMFNIQEKDFIETIWGNNIVISVKKEIEFNIDRLKSLKKNLDRFEDLEKFSKVICQDYIILEELIKKETWDEIYEYIWQMQFERWPQDKKVTNPLKEEAKEKRNKIKDEIKKIKEKIFISDSKQACQDIKEMYNILNSLKNIVLEFMQDYSKAKKEKNIIDFNDIEHFALNILVKESEDGKITPTHIAKKYQEKFAEIAIDEYQDSNLVQEYILSTISKGNNMFMVGDVKQSIYKFRQACPDLFLQKYENYKLKENKKEEDSLKIQLFKNFRSRKNVLDITNLVFQDIMSKELGDIEYNTVEYLNLGADYKKPISAESVKTQIEIIDLKQQSQEDDEEEKQEEIIENIAIEAKFVAKQIKQILESDTMVFDRKMQDYRKATYKDIVILLRSTANSAPIFENEISSLGFPVFSDTSSGYLDTQEIQVIISLLKIIDNPMQDIPLVTVLRSVIGGFDDNELIEIRMIGRNTTFYESMLKYLEEEPTRDHKLQEKIKSFLVIIEKWRKKQEYMPLDELIWEIYMESGYYYYASLMPNGALRIANLKLLFEKAKQYEKSSFKGLFNFINFIEKLKNTSGDFGSAKLIGENDNVIRIMSIHKSKGLEFPIVFLSGTGKRFNLQDLNEAILLHQDLGFGPEYISKERMIQYNTLAKEAIKQKTKDETIAEEMRILYVALTRAKEKLIITGISKDIEKELKEKQEILDGSKKQQADKINQSVIRKAKSYLDWIEMVYLNHKEEADNYFSVNIHTKQEILDDKQEEKIEQDIFEKIENLSKNEELTKRIIEKLNWKYPYKISSEIPTKSSVTKIKKMSQEENEDKEKVILQEPKFIKEQVNISAAQKGTLIHMCLQRLDTSKDYQLEEIKQMVNKMQKDEVILPNEAQSINIQKIYNFTKSNLYRQIKMAKKVYKEQPFYINIPVKEIYNEDTDENILVQGIIDLYYIGQNGELVLVDYKTDYVQSNNANELIEKYKKQLEIYKRALEEALSQKVDKVYIYSTYLDKEIEI